MAKLEDTIQKIKKEIPNFEVKAKNKDPIQTFIGKMSMFFNYGKVTTAIYPAVWVPTRADMEEYDFWKTLEHEFVHLKDAKTFFGLLPFLPDWINKWLFLISYSFPQNFAIFSLLFFISPWFLLCLLFLLPIPAPFRMWTELKAYKITYQLSSKKKEVLDNIVGHFSGSSYYFMWPFKKWIERKISEE